MSFNDNIRINSGRERGGRGGGGMSGRGIAVGGGGGILGLVVVLVLVFSGNGDMLTGGSQVGGAGTGAAGGAGSSSDFDHCQTGADANKYVDCRVIATMQSTDAVWQNLAPQIGLSYKQPGLDLFSGGVNTGCGQASSAVGPFYCPADQFVYIDTSFFDQLSSTYGASTGPLAQEFVVAHEVGHHVSNMLGTLKASRQDPQGPESGAVRVELQADCFAGIWAHHAASTPAPGSDTPFLKALTSQDISDALSAAAAVGDDRIQEKATGQVNPETWTHGSAEMRMEWFTTGYETGDPSVCDTFSANLG